MFLFIISIISVVCSFFYKKNSIYDISDNFFCLKVIDIKKDEDKITLTLDGDEKLIGTYYYKDKNEISSIKYGSIVYVEGTLKSPSNNTVPYAFNYKKYLNNKNIYYVLSINKIKVVGGSKGLYKIKNFIDKRINEIDNTGYMEAFILGNKDYIDEDNYNNFQSLGVTHLFAISGMHIGLMSGVLIKVFKRLKDGLKYLIIDILLIAYGFIICFPSSLKRCLLFYIISSLNKIFDLNLNNKKILFITISLLIIFEPLIIHDIGFLFSVCTVGGIVLCSNFITGNCFIKMFKLSVIAFLFSLPINLYFFYEFNLFSILYNMFFIPFISFIVYPLSIVSFIFPFLYSLFHFFIDVLDIISNFLGSINIFNFFISFNLYEVWLFFLFLLLIFVWKKKYVVCFLLLIIIIDCFFPFLDENMYVYYFDVGQGDSNLIVTPNRREVILIDTGGSSKYEISKNYLPLLKHEGIRKINYLILSHGDFDHIGEAIKLVNNFKVENVIFNCGEYNDLEKELIKVLDKKKIKYCSCIKELNIDKYKLLFLNTKEYDNENENSNVIYFNYNNYKFLFMGDAGAEKEDDILEKYNLKDIDFLKVGHHGSNTSSSEYFINSVNPKYSLISVGAHNRYGHPKDEVLDTLKNSKIYRTDLDGSIEIKLNKNEYKIRICPP